MGLYIERDRSPITLEEWYDYIKNDNELTLSEIGTAINPITKAKMTFNITGRAIWNEDCELTYDNGKIRGEGTDIKSLIIKLSKIAAVLSASVFDCGERLGV